MKKDYVKIQEECWFDEEGDFCSKIKVIEKGKCSTEFKDALWEEISIDLNKDYKGKEKK